eukprot:COSAG02_NODE_1391_length_12911_cov_246.579145_4_plen_160_part_00
MGGRSALEVNVLAGGGAGLIETSATYPLDLAKTRQQLSMMRSSATVPQVLREVFREAGLRGLYSGISAPLLSEVPRRALKFTMNGLFKQSLAPLWPEPRSVSGNVALSTVAGSLAGEAPVARTTRHSADTHTRAHRNLSATVYCARSNCQAGVTARRSF